MEDGERPAIWRESTLSLLDAAEDTPAGGRTTARPQAAVATD